MHILCKCGLSTCCDKQCVRQRKALERRQEQQARGKARLLRKEIQRRFCPGTMGIARVADSRGLAVHERHVFTAVAWMQTERGWEALVLMNDVLSTWGWSTFEQCSTLEEFARG